MQRSLLRPLCAALLSAGLATMTACTISSTGNSSDTGIAGGTGDTGSGNTTDNGDATGNTAGGSGSSATVNISISGVAATGAPLLGAKIRVVDAVGKAINLQDAAGNEISTDSSSTADGSFRLTVAKTARPVLPLLLQARGQDASGKPVVLHSLLPSASTTIANITPFTDATVAQLLGANPATILQNPSANSSLLTILGNTTAVSNAANQVKSIIKANLSAAKITNATTLDLFQSVFTSNKTGQDLILEGLRIGISQSSNGKDVLQIGNKFVRAAEVSVDLATARTELLKTIGGDVSKAISSTLKATTSPTLTNLETLDLLGSGLNALIAQNGSPDSFVATPLLASYTRHNGRTQVQLAAKLLYFASRGYQLSNFQLVGCAEDPLPTKGCSNFNVAALVTDNKGNQVEAFTDVASYSGTTKQWQLIGNGLATSAAVYPTAFSSFDQSGTQLAATTSAPNPVVGVEVQVNAVDETPPPANPNQIISSAIVTIPSGYSIPLAFCSQKALCVSGVPAPSPTNTLQDTMLLQTAKGWVGSSKDGAAGAQYLFSITPFPAATALTLSSYLPASINIAPASSVFPQFDDVSAAAPLTVAKIVAGTRLSWKKWASANPDMQVFTQKILAAGGTPPVSGFVLSETRIPDPIASPSINIGSTSLTIPALASAGATGLEIWLGAQDSQGRRYYSKYSISQ